MIRDAYSFKSLLTLLCAAGAIVASSRGSVSLSGRATLARVGWLAPEGGAAWAVRAGRASHFAPADAARERRVALRVQSPGSWSAPVSPPPHGRLRFGFSVEPPEARVSLLVRLERERGGELLARAEATGERGWQTVDVDLSRFAGERAELEITLAGEPASVALSAPELLAPAAPGPAPHVLVYVVDCLRADHVGAYGYARPTTPHFDALARHAVVFEQAWSCASWTKPSVACLLTGLPGVRHGARTLDDALDPGVTTLAEVFGRAGYASAAFVDNPFVSAASFGLTRGFDSVRQAPAAPGRRNVNSLEGDAFKLQRALAPWLLAHADRRFLLYAHSIDLHAEYRPRPPFTRLFTRPGAAPRDVDLYDAELRANDEAFGRLVALLRRVGLYERTLIVLTADHGEEFGEHGAWRHGHTLNQGLLQVPLIVKLPGPTRAGRRVADPVSNVDVLPTLLDLAGLPRPAGVEGRSLRPLVEGRARAARRTIFAEQLSPHEALYAARDARYKAVQQLLPRPARRLFDLSRDPHERHDLSAAPPAAAGALLRELDGWVAGAQAGWHVALASGAPPGEMTLRVQTEARIVDAQRFALEQGETFALSADGRRLEYRFRVGARPRHVVVRTEPATAPLRLQLLRDGRALPADAIGLGAAQTRPVSLPLDLDWTKAQAPATRVVELLEASAPLARIWYLAARLPDSRAPLDPELQAHLRALGYLH